jgi:hypothetical protein
MILGIALDEAGILGEPESSRGALHLGTLHTCRLFKRARNHSKSRVFSKECDARRGFIQRFSQPIHSQISQIKRLSRATAEQPNQELPLTSSQP